MTNKPAWVSFGTGLNITESTFSKPIAGSSLGQGLHEDVTIEGIEPGSNPQYPGVKITWSKDGETRNDMVFFLNYEKDGLSSQYLALATALCSDILLRNQFFGHAVPANPALLNSLVGSKANIKVGYKKVSLPETKYRIVNLNDGQYSIVDAFDGETIPEELEASYGSYEEVKNAAEEHGLALTYLNVLKVTSPTDKEALEAQTGRIREALEGATTKTKKTDTF
jgi:hypothetical protein